MKFIKYYKLVQIIKLAVQTDLNISFTNQFCLMKDLLLNSYKHALVVQNPQLHITH